MEGKVSMVWDAGCLLKGTRYRDANGSVLTVIAVSDSFEAEGERMITVSVESEHGARFDYEFGILDPVEVI